MKIILVLAIISAALTTYLVNGNPFFPFRIATPKRVPIYRNIQRKINHQKSIQRKFKEAAKHQAIVVGIHSREYQSQDRRNVKTRNDRYRYQHENYDKSQRYHENQQFNKSRRIVIHSSKLPKVFSLQHLNLSTTTIAPKPSNNSITAFSFEPISFVSNNVSDANKLIQTTNGTSTHLSSYTTLYQ